MRLRSDGTEWLKPRPHIRSSKVKVYKGYEIIFEPWYRNWVIEGLPDLGGFVGLDEAIKAIDYHLAHGRQK